jgi:Mrp family chromosome partitioning ATPase/capsular polysaccharide biosynthesis protein
MVVAVVAALAYSHVKTPSYQSSSLIQLNTTNTTTGQSSSPVTFPSPVQLLESTAVQDEAARTLNDPDVAAVTDEVTGTVDPNTGALTIVATASNPARAQDVAKAYTQAFQDQMQAIVQSQVNKIHLQMDSVQSQITSLQDTPGATNNPGIQAQIAGLGQTYGTLQSQLSTINLGEPYSSVQVAAGLPTAPIGLGKSKVLGIGILAGLLVGCGAALVREQFDTRLRTSPDIAEVSNAPVLAELPQDADVRTGKVSIALVQAPQSRMAESVRELRTSLRVILDDAPCPALMVTSPEAGDGKTFVAANLAAAWALSGSKVIVVSADFRRPRLEEVFGLQPTGLPGLADAIKANWKKPESEIRRSEAPLDAPPRSGMGPVRSSGGQAQATARRLDPNRRVAAERTRHAGEDTADESSVGTYLVDTGIWGLSLLPAGTHLDTPSELFGSPGMQPVMDQLPLLADIVLFDSPPVLAAPDAAILGGLAHGAVVVASEGKTDRNDLERTVHRLESTHCRVLGVAVNRTRKPSTDAYQYYAYKQQ